MAVTVANASVQPISGSEVACANIAGGPFDNIDAYVSGGAWSQGQLLFKLYATVGGVTGVVAIATYSGPNPARLQWQEVEGDLSPVHAGGTVYTLKVYGQAPQFTSQNQAIFVGPTAIAVTLAGVDASDTVPVTNSSATVSVPGTGSEVTVTTAAGFIESADVLADMTGAPPLQFTLYADCGGGSVVAPIATAQTGGSDALAAVLRQVPLGVATNYTLKVKKVIQDGVTSSITAALATYTEGAGGGGGGAVPLSPEVSGPSNANVVTGPFSQATLKWKNTVAAALLSTNLAGATASLGFGASVTALTLDPVAGDTFFDVTSVARAAITLAHGVILAGGGGGDYYAAIGPLTGFEGSNAALWLLPNGIVRTASNYAIFNTASGLFIAPRLGGGTISFADGGGGVAFLVMSASVQEIKTTVQFDRVAAPAAAPNSVNVYTDTLDNALKAIGASGDITIMAPA